MAQTEADYLISRDSNMLSFKTFLGGNVILTFDGQTLTVKHPRS